MPYITITVDESPYRDVRLWAATHNTTATQVVRSFLQVLTYPPIDSVELKETLHDGLLEEHAELFNSHSRLPFMERK